MTSRVPTSRRASAGSFDGLTWPIGSQLTINDCHAKKASSAKSRMNVPGQCLCLAWSCAGGLDVAEGAIGAGSGSPDAAPEAVDLSAAAAGHDAA